MKAGAVSRRGFVKSMAVAGLAVQAGSLFAQTAGAGKRRLKIGLVGCGGRGSGALANLLEAAPLAGVEIEVYAVADAFKSRVDGAVTKFGVAADRGFVGFDAYRKVMAEPVDLVVLATPPRRRGSIASSKNRSPSMHRAAAESWPRARSPDKKVSPWLPVRNAGILARI